MNNQGDGFLNGILGFFYGCQADKTKPGQCYDTVEQGVLLAEAVSASLSKFYLPSEWANLLKDGNSYLSIFASVYGLCDTQNLINIVSGLISAEGASSLGAQMGGSLIFDLPTQWKKFQQAPSTF